MGCRKWATFELHFGRPAAEMQSRAARALRGKELSGMANQIRCAQALSVPMPSPRARAIAVGLHFGQPACISAADFFFPGTSQAMRHRRPVGARRDEKG